MYKHLLVPLDGSGLATEIVSQAVAFAAALGARISFFTAQADFSSTDQGALQRTVAPDAFAANLAGEAQGILQKAEAAASAKGVPCSLVSRVSDRPAAAIVAEAERLGCDLIFMASHGHKGLRALVLGSQTQKVLANARLPVLVASVESQQPERDMLVAIAIIQDEHRSLAAVVRALQALVEEAAGGSGPLDVPLLQAMLRYIEAFPERLHHPKENDYLFRHLAARTKAFDGAIALLRAEHLAGDALLQAMQSAVDEWAAARDEAARQAAKIALAGAVKRFAEAQWAHMNLEENTILPGAREHLTTDDWREIRAAFAENGDPRFDTDLDDDFKQLYARIIHLAIAKLE
ncbi:universal stress protein [Azonexus sp.]|uniref:universal stress protein n=1 Tax=Azonexus sp. TaxID=1872668 RepID=UPI0027B8BE9C|nr:universal stress protein [Azonexus sp.]